MVKTFKNSGIGQFVLFIAAALLLWGRALVSPCEMVDYDGFSPLYEALYRGLSDDMRWAAVIAFVLTVVESIWMSTLLYNYKLVQQNSLLPALLYMTAMSFDQSSLTLTPQLLVNIPILFFLDRIMVLGSPNLQYHNIFDSAAGIALAALFYVPALYLLVPYLIVFLMYKQYRWHDWVVMLLGLMAPAIIFAMVYFMNENLGHSIYLMGYDLSSPELKVEHVSTYRMVANGLMVVMLLTGLIFTSTSASDMAADSKKNATIIVMLLIYSATQLFYTRLYPIDLQLVAPTFAFVMTTFLFGGRRRQWISDLTLGAILLLSIL